MIEQLLALEHAGWRSLCDGTAAKFYRDIMTTEGKMVLADGSLMNRDEVAAALQHAPPWEDYKIENASIVPIAAESAAIVYTGTGHRDDGTSFTALMSPVYVRIGGDWKLALYAQTPLQYDG